jgi:hypothetical protein
MNKIEPLKDEELLQPKQWAEIDARNPLVGYRPAAGIYTLNLEIDEDAWLAFKRSVPKGSLMCVRFYYHDGDLIKEKTGKVKAEPKQKGEFGELWRDLFLTEFYNNHDLHHVLGLPTPSGLNAVKAALYKVFNVSSLSFVSFTDLALWCDRENLHSLAITARRLEAESNAKS